MNFNNKASSLRVFGNFTFREGKQVIAFSCAGRWLPEQPPHHKTEHFCKNSHSSKSFLGVSPGKGKNKALQGLDHLRGLFTGSAGIEKKYYI